MTLTELINSYIRVMSYSTVILCSVYDLRMKKFGIWLTIGDILLSIFCLFAISYLHITGDKNVYSTIFTVGMFLWMIVHLFNTLSFKK